MDKFEQIMNGTPIYEDGKKLILLTPNMSLRDYFAGQAMVGLLANGQYRLKGKPLTYQNTAVAAYDLADAMLAESEKGEEK